VVNDFARFFTAHAGVTDVLFNGGMAETCFRRYVLPAIDVTALRFERMPSTSPAHASLSRAKKLELWRNAFEMRGIILAFQKKGP
jgi:G:T/U-mismatch repair DNA glycosylase